MRVEGESSDMRSRSWLPSSSSSSSFMVLGMVEGGGLPFESARFRAGSESSADARRMLWSGCALLTGLLYRERVRIYSSREKKMLSEVAKGYLCAQMTQGRIVR